MGLKINKYLLPYTTTEGEEVHYNLPDGATAIPENAFRGDTSIAEIAIPDYVTRIERNAFLGCTNLKKIDVHVSTDGIECWINHCSSKWHAAADEAFIHDLVAEGYAADLNPDHWR